MKNKLIIEKLVFITSDKHTVFEVLKDVTHWYAWTKSINQISLQNTNEFKEGTKIKVWQPKLFPAIWTITHIEENRLLIWIKKSFGLNMVATHFIKEVTGGVEVKLEMIYEGTFSKLAYLLSKKLTAEYLTIEANGLKEKCEQLTNDLNQKHS